MQGGGIVNELALFAGAGGGILGGHLLGWRTVCAVEWEPYAASVLVARQNDGILPPFPVWDDVQTFDGRPWRGIVDVVSGGFPCQDISAAGKGAGIEGAKSGMWKHMARIVGEVRPRGVFVENSPMLTSRGLGRVLGDLAAMGFNAQWGVLGAASVGAPHQRDRIWIAGWTDVFPHAELLGLGWRKQQQKSVEEETAFISYTKSAGQLREKQLENNCRRERGREVTDDFDQKNKIRSQDVAYTNSTQCQRNERSERTSTEHPNFGSTSWWQSEPDVGRVANGVAARVDRLKAIGNGQVPAVAATAFRRLTKC